MKRQHTFSFFNQKLLTCLSTSGWWFFFSWVQCHILRSKKQNGTKICQVFFFFFHLSWAGKLYFLFRGLLMIPVGRLGGGVYRVYDVYTLSLCTVYPLPIIIHTTKSSSLASSGRKWRHEAPAGTVERMIGFLNINIRIPTRRTTVLCTSTRFRAVPCRIRFITASALVHEVRTSNGVCAFVRIYIL